MFKPLFIAAGLTIAGAGAASAATITAATADCALGNSTSIQCGVDDRRDLDNVELGAGDGDFFSLGLGGSATFTISPYFTGPLSVVEVTFGNSYPVEKADVFVGLAGSFTKIGTVTNQSTSGVLGAGVTSISFSGTFDQIRFTDMSEGPANGDGFDLDAFTVTAVPLPASALLLAFAVGGLGFVRRRKSA